MGHVSWSLESFTPSWGGFLFYIETNALNNAHCIQWSSHWTWHITLYTLQTAQYTPHKTHCKLHNEQYTQYQYLCFHTALNTLHTAQYTLHTAQYTLDTTNDALHTEQYTLYTVQYKLHSEQYILHSVQYKLHNEQYTLHSPHCIIYSSLKGLNQEKLSHQSEQL